MAGHLQLADCIILAWRVGIIKRGQSAKAIARAHSLYETVRDLRRGLMHAIELTAPAIRQANLYWHLYESGEFGAADKAHALYDEAIGTLRSFGKDFGRSIEFAMALSNQATLFGRQFEQGDMSAASKAIILHEEALDILRKNERDLDSAMVASNLANLYLAQFGQERSQPTILRAHSLYDKALMTLRSLGRPFQLALTLSAKADAHLSQLRAGFPIPEDQTHAFYVEAIDISRRFGNDVEVARNLDHQGCLYTAQFRAGEAGAAGKAHALYDEALGIFRRLGREVEVAMTAQNQAWLCQAQLEAGEAGAAGKAHVLYDEALSSFRRLGRWINWLMTARNRLRLLEAEGRWADVGASTGDILLTARGRLPDLCSRADRDRLLTEIVGVGARGAAAMLRFGTRGDVPLPDQVRDAVRLLEEGRAQQLGARLREALAHLDDDARAELDLRLLAYQQAGAAADWARAARDEAHARAEAAGDDATRAAWTQRRLEASAELKAAELSLGEAHAPLAKLKAQLGLDDITIPLRAPVELAAALDGAALVQAVPGHDGGWLLLLAPGASDGQAIPAEALTVAAVNAATARYFAHVDHFQSGRLSDGRPCPPGRQYDPINAFSVALEARLLPGDAEAPGIWDLITGPVHRALVVAGMAPAPGANTAPEVVFCLPAYLSMLPIHAARDPATGRPFHEDYASRLVPSLGALVASAHRARRLVTPDLLAITDPLDDLEVPTNPVAGLFPAEAQRNLAGYRFDPRRSNVATWRGLAAAVEEACPSYMAYYGHSLWDSRDGEGSGLVLAPELEAEGRIPVRITLDAEGRTHVDVLPDLATPSRVRGLGLHATRLVFSASCGGAGLGLGIARDEMGGLPAAWLEAGAAGMISSLYTVLSGPAALVMHGTFAALLDDGLSPTQALRRARTMLARAFDEEPKALTASGTDSPGPRYSAPPARTEAVPTSFIDAGTPDHPRQAPPGIPAIRTLHPTAHIAAFVIFGQWAGKELPRPLESGKSRPFRKIPATRPKTPALSF